MTRFTIRIRISIQSDNILKAYESNTIKSFYPHASQRRAKPNVSGSACPVEVSSALALWATQCGSYAEDRGNFIPGDVFGFMHHSAAFIGVNGAPPLTLYPD